MDGETNSPKPICPFNFFEVGGITMNKIKCTSYGPDKLAGPRSEIGRAPDS